MVVHGLSKFQTNWITADPSTRTLSLSISVPRMDIAGLYRIKGKVIFIDLEGAGDFTTVLQGVTGEGKVIHAVSC